MPESPVRGFDIGSGASNSPDKGRSFFLGIGIDEYLHFPKLNNAVKDVLDVLQLLKARYDIGETLTLLNDQATRQGIIKALGNLTRSVGVQDKLIIYYSGHGYKDNTRNRGYWVPHDAIEGRMDTYISNSIVRDYIEDIQAKHNLLIADACFSGALLKYGATRYAGKLDDMEQIDSRWVMCSGRDNEVVADGKPGENSPFAASIIQLLKNNQDLKLNVVMLAEQVLRQIKGTYHQLPLCEPLNVQGHKGGQYVFHLKKGVEAAWAETCAENTLPAYTNFLIQFPDSSYTKEALDAISKLENERIAWEVAQKEHTISSYAAFYQAYPNSPFAPEAKAKMELLLGLTPAKKPTPNSSRQPGEIVTGDGKTGTFTDPRDGYTYPVVKLKDGNWWFAENLRYEIEDSWFYNNDPEKGEKYGRLYTWKAAKKAVPEGWRLPEDEAWDNLRKLYGGESAKAYKALKEGGSSGFAAQLGGFRKSSGEFISLGRDGNFWSASEYDADYAWYFYFNGDNQRLYRYYYDKSLGFSVRCVQDLNR